MACKRCKPLCVYAIPAISCLFNFSKGYKVDASASSKLVMTYICTMCVNTMCGGKPTAKLRTGDVENTELQMVTLLASSYVTEYCSHQQS